MEDKTDVAKVSLPVLFRSLFFQVAKRDFIFSMMKLKSLFLGRPWSIGKPKYLPSEDVLWIPDIVVRLVILP